MIGKIIEFLLAIIESRKSGIDAYLEQSIDIADLECRQKYLRHMGHL